MEAKYKVINATDRNITLQVTLGTNGFGHTLAYLADTLIAQSATAAGDVPLFAADRNNRLEEHPLTGKTSTIAKPAEAAPVSSSDISSYYSMNGGFSGLEVFQGDADEITASSTGSSFFIEKLIDLA